MKVKLLQSLAGADRHWAVGDSYECEAEEAARLINAGIGEDPATKKAEGKRKKGADSAETATDKQAEEAETATGE